MSEEVKEKDKKETEESEVFFDANDYFEEKVEESIKKKGLTEKKRKKKDWLGLNWIYESVTHRSDEPKDEKLDKKANNKETIISIKDELRNSENGKQTSDGSEGKSGINGKKVTKVEISDNDTSDETESRRMEVTVINEDNTHIDSDDIEMSAFDSIKFLVNIIAVHVLSLFIISGTCHWIYNHLNGLDWHLNDKTYYNFHIFFMCLGICSFSIGLLSHRMFRGLSSGALNFMHTTITLITLIFFLIGYYAVVVSLENKQSIHFYSVHSWLGLIAIATFALQWLSGLVIFIFPRFVYDIQALLIPIHSFFGRIIFSLLCGTAITGFSDKLKITDSSISLGPIDEDFDSNETIEITIDEERESDEYWNIPEEAFLCNIIAIVILLYILCVNYLISNDTFRRRLLPEEQGIEIKTRIK